MRSSSEPLSAAFISGAVTQGADVIDVGLATTDMLYYAAGSIDVPGVMFTASHNPAKYNGIKLCRAGAAPIGIESGLAEIKAMVAGAEFPEPRRLGAIARRDLMGEYLDHVFRFVDPSAFRPMKVAIDCANGMGGLSVPRVFARLPMIEVVPLYFELDGTFPNHPADPIQPENLRDLQRAVRETGAVCGIAFDGDADRVFFVDERGEPVLASFLGAMLCAPVLERAPGSTILYSLTCSRAVPETIAEHGGSAVRTRVGHSFMKAVMAETGAVFGVEHSGHFYLRDHWRAECGVVTALQALEVVARSGGTMSEALHPYSSRWWNSGEINSEVEDKAGAVERIADSFDGTQDRTDGLSVEWGDRWFNVRASNTEPLLRLNVEARDRATGEALRDEVLALIRV